MIDLHGLCTIRAILLDGGAKMVPYFLTFFASCVFCYLGEKSLKSTITIHQKPLLAHGAFVLRKSTVFFSYSVLLVAALAGARGYTVGTDIKTYGNDFYYYAKTVSYSTLIKTLPQIEPLYLALVKISSLISTTPHFLYFLNGLLVYSFMMAGFVYYEKYLSITFSWFGFLCLLYGDTYNAMRQCIAIAICFWAFHYVEERKYIRFALWIIIAFNFHNTAIILVFIAFAYILLKKNNTPLIKITIAAVIILALLEYNTILTFLIQYGLLDLKMTKYFISGRAPISIPALLIRLPFLILIFIQYNDFKSGFSQTEEVQALESDSFSDFLVLMLLFELFTVEMSALVATLYRISLYAVPFRCISYARLFSIGKKNKKMYFVLLIVYLALIFVYQNCIKGNNEIYPYVFGLFE
ncbi:hypothetical protein CHR60_11655 [Faecalibacterium prausnitzii]|uniref:EpsG family protein n=2 Tax=Faecalibacterium prausnitzii TaxID=853 RepID=A0A2A7B2T8_9FIRM|nr:hypothetical protein CHR60_11655 [Faecalibacterium prausnitzii]